MSAASDLGGQVALVTGASRGIGRAIATALARAGAAEVVLNYQSNEAAAEEAASAVREAGAKASLARFDIADAEATEKEIKALVARCERLDILVNNAGFTADNLIVRQKEEEWTRVLAVNLGGAFHCVKTAARTMMRARYGRIINISSVIADMGNAGQGAYAAAKAGLLGFTRSMARELAPRGITVNAVSPGFIETDMIRDLPDSVRQQYLQLIPLERLGTAEEVADAVTFLARPQSGYITGHVLAVNGGMVM
jgi:3-oxoacyl-[acyl-carrier protein] reductase